MFFAYMPFAGRAGYKLVSNTKMVQVWNPIDICTIDYLIYLANLQSNIAVIYVITPRCFHQNLFGELRNFLPLEAGLPLNPMLQDLSTCAGSPPNSTCRVPDLHLNRGAIGERRSWGLNGIPIGLFMEFVHADNEPNVIFYIG